MTLDRKIIQSSEMKAEVSIVECIDIASFATKPCRAACRRASHVTSVCNTHDSIIVQYTEISKPMIQRTLSTLCIVYYSIVEPHRRASSAMHFHIYSGRIQTTCKTYEGGWYARLSGGSLVRSSSVSRFQTLENNDAQTFDSVEDNDLFTQSTLEKLLGWKNSACISVFAICI